MARAAKSVCVAMAMIVAAAVAPSNAAAGGYGIYLETELSDASIDKNIPFNIDRVERDFESVTGGVGFIYDTNVSRDKVWNYRVKLGYRYGHRDFDENTDVTVPRRADQEDPDLDAITFRQNSDDAQGLTLGQTVGYGFLRNSTLRVWAGPNLRLNVDWFGVAPELDVVDIAVGAGPELGINYHLNDRISLSGSISYNYLYLSEYFETVGDDERFEGSQHLLAITFSVLFRTESDRWGE